MPKLTTKVRLIVSLQRLPEGVTKMDLSTKSRSDGVNSNSGATLSKNEESSVDESKNDAILDLTNDNKEKTNKESENPSSSALEIKTDPVLVPQTDSMPMDTQTIPDDKLKEDKPKTDQLCAEESKSEIAQKADSSSKESRTDPDKSTEGAAISVSGSADDTSKSNDEISLGSVPLIATAAAATGSGREDDKNKNVPSSERPEVKTEQPVTSVGESKAPITETKVPQGLKAEAMKSKSIFSSLFPSTVVVSKPSAQAGQQSIKPVDVTTKEKTQATPVANEPSVTSTSLSVVKDSMRFSTASISAPESSTSVTAADKKSDTIESSPVVVNTVSTESSIVQDQMKDKIAPRGETVKSSPVPPVSSSSGPLSKAESTTSVPKEGDTLQNLEMEVDGALTPMDVSAEPTPIPTKPSAPEPTIKTEVKHPPAATKTMKKERKPSNTSPTLPGEQKKSGHQKSKTSASPGGKSKKERSAPKEEGHDGRNDFYCWICHREGEVLCCELCPRVFHAKCLNMTEEPEGDWFCPECEKITDAECKETQSRAMSMLTTEQFSLLLKYVIQRMKIPGTEPFHEPVDTKMFPDYVDYVFHPMDLSTIEKSVKKKKYGCPEAFVLDFKWVIHNCIIYNSMQSKLTQIAKSMLKIAERELNEIEVCPECYLNSCRKRENWFCEPCKELHPLVWAKLQGFPHWPAKALRIEKGVVDVRFFGQHDRAWIPLSGCYLISKELPLPVKNKKKNKGPALRGGLDGAMQEMQVYIDNIKKITGEFEYAPPRTLLTHCDLYRKTGSAGKSLVRTPDLSKSRDGQTESKDTSPASAKIELKDLASTKEFVKSPGLSLTPKKGKLVTTRGEHPTRPFATKKKRASMEFLNKTIESCKASLGIEKLQDVKMNSGSDDTTSSSDDEEESKDEKPTENKKKEAVSLTEVKPTEDEDDSDAELVIDLGDMEDPASTTESKQQAESEPKSDETAVKKRKLDEGSDKQPPQKPGLKSILLNPVKSSDKDERKKMLAKALSEKIATGKRKYDTDGAQSGASPSNKVRKTGEPSERSRSPVDPHLKSLGKSGHVKEKKKSHHGGKHSEKDGSGKIKTGILKSSTDGSSQKKEVYASSEKRLSDTAKKVSSGSSKHKDPRDGGQKLSSKKQTGTDKTGKLEKVGMIPTEADTRKLFNGGRIPRKNPIANTSDEESGEKQQEDRDGGFMETNSQTSDIITRRSLDRGPQTPQTTNRMNGFTRRTSIDTQSKNIDITFDSLKKYKDKVMESVQKVFYEMYTDMLVPLQTSFVSDNLSSTETNAATATTMHQVAQLRLELERLKWMHEQEIAELKHNHDLTVAEIRQSLENEKKQLLLDARLQAETEKQRAVDEAKRKQWCAYCNKEAIFYCCWNTSYCDYPCQQKHWPQHMNSCTQAGESAGGAQGAGALEPKTTPGKIAPPVTTTLPTTTSAPLKTTPPVASSSTTTSKLLASTKSTIIFPSSIQITKPSQPSLVGKAAAKTTQSAASEKIVKVSIPSVPESVTQQKSSGLSISAIGARLLAAKQGSGPSKDVKETTTTKSSSTKVDITVATSNAPRFSDHVKTTLESPLSPDAKSTPIHIMSSLAVDSAKTSSAESSTSSKTVSVQPVGTKVTASTPLASATPSTSSNKTSISSLLVTTPSQSKDPDPLTSKSSSEKSSVNEKAQSIPETAKKTFGGRLGTSNLQTFSSPSVIASLITEMDTPLSSSLSSSPGDSSSSFLETPEKTTDAKDKVELPVSGSAFTKVVPDTSKQSVQSADTSACKAEKSQKSLSFSIKPPVTSSSAKSESPTFRPIDVTAAKDARQGEGTLPQIAPVFTDSYLSKLQQNLTQKSMQKAKGDEILPDPPDPSGNKESKPAAEGELLQPTLASSQVQESVTTTTSS